MTTDQGLLNGKNIIRKSLLPYGYTDSHIRFDCRIPDPAVVRQYTLMDDSGKDDFPKGSPVILDVLAFFDDKRQDWNTPAIGAALQRHDVVGNRVESDRLACAFFQLTTAPVSIVGSFAKKKVDVWLHCHDGRRAVFDVNLDVEELIAVFRDNRNYVQRESLARLRAGQRHLFDSYLYAKRKDLASLLQKGVSSATRSVNENSWGHREPEARLNRERFSRVALGLLAARILEDKQSMVDGESNQCKDPRELLIASADINADFFKALLCQDVPPLDHRFGPNVVDRMLRHVLAYLTGPINLALVTHEMLGDLYETAHVVEKPMSGHEHSEVKGVHYTPYAIARQIVDRIPLEDLPIQERVVLDFACGSGSFLLAATDRLTDLFNQHEPGAPPDLSSHIRESVLGNDIDSMAILITRLSYLIAYWSPGRRSPVIYPTVVEKHDATSGDFNPRVLFEGKAPRVIVTNPPFDSDIPVALFLQKALHLLSDAQSKKPGYVGIVLPATFLTGTQGFEAVRSLLLRTARILEIWELPERTIGLQAEVPTCVVLAEVSARRTGILRISQTRSRKREAIDKVRDAGIPACSYVAEIENQNTIASTETTPALSFAPIDSVWAKLCTKGTMTLRRVAETCWGFTHTQGTPNPCFCHTRKPRYVPFIRRQVALMPYILRPSDWKRSHGEKPAFWLKGSGSRPRENYWPKYESPKIVVSARRNRNSRVQAFGAVDLNGVYPGKDFIVITLKDNWRSAWSTLCEASRRPEQCASVLRWVCALMNSPVGQAWFAKNAGPRGIADDACLNFPIPQIYDSRIATIVVDLERMPPPPQNKSIPIWDFKKGRGPYWSAVAEISELVSRSYGLCEEECLDLMRFLNSTTGPWLEHDTGSGTSAGVQLRTLRGKVCRINPTLQTLCAGLSWRSLGNYEQIEIPIPKLMPGWCLDPDREFTCRAPLKTTLEVLRLDPWILRDFRPVSYEYLDEKTLEQMIGFESAEEHE